MPNRQSWLVFMDEVGRARVVAAPARRRQLSSSKSMPGDAFGCTREDRYSLAPERGRRL